MKFDQVPRQPTWALEQQSRSFWNKLPRSFNVSFIASFSWFVQRKASETPIEGTCEEWCCYEQAAQGLT